MARPVRRTRINGRASSMLVRGAAVFVWGLLIFGHLDKKLLITCLQFLNNLIARNEQRKLMLWIELFDSHLDNELPNFADMKYKMDMFPHLERGSKAKSLLASSHWWSEKPEAAHGPDTFKIPQQPASSPFLLFIGEIGNEVKKSLAQQGEKAGATEIAAECRRRWQTMTEEEKNVGLHEKNTVSITFANIRRNGTCCTQTLSRDTAMRLPNPAHTRKSWTSTPRTRKACRLSRKASTNFKSRWIECDHPSQHIQIPRSLIN